jgi:UDP-2,3-diacylglucosamine pyrophosphatase LpxH
LAVSYDGRAMAVRLDPASRALFLSDLHFGDGTTTDLFGQQDERLIAFIEEQRQHAETIVFLGDILDVPQAWTTGRILAAHAGLIAYLRQLVREERVIFVRGNHDWNVDYEGLFPGSTRCEQIEIGERVLVWHGHQMDLHMHPGVQGALRNTYLHAIAERFVGGRLVPPLERYDSIPNRVGLSLAVGWARVLMWRAARARVGGDIRSADDLEASVRYLARSVSGDPADLFGATTRTVLGEDYDMVLCGHNHEPGVVHTERGVFANTGTWAKGMRTYARWETDGFVVRDVDSDRIIGDEHYRDIPSETLPEDVFRWWRGLWQRGLFRGPPA